jgi:hypothetical protein
MIVEKIYEEIEKENKKCKHTDWNWASELGHPCLKYLVWIRKKPYKASPPSEKQKLDRYEGKIHEKAIIEELKKNFRIDDEHTYWEWEKYQIRGRLDALLIQNNERIPIEIKTTSSQQVFDSIKSFEDMLNSPCWYVRKYPVQMTLYLQRAGVKRGYFILKNRFTGDLKEIEVGLNLKLLQQILEKADKINYYISKNIEPKEGINDPQVCITCPFSHICIPSKKYELLEVLQKKGGEEIMSHLDRFYELQKYMKEYQEIKDYLLQVFESIPHVKIEGWGDIRTLKNEKGEYEIQVQKTSFLQEKRNDRTFKKPEKTVKNLEKL